MIEDGTARRIAAEWHGGIRSDLYAFVSTGTIRPTLHEETGQLLLDADVHAHGAEAIDELTLLHAYVVETGERGPQAGWAELWETCAKCHREIWLRKVARNATTNVGVSKWCHHKYWGKPTMICPEGGEHKPV